MPPRYYFRSPSFGIVPESPTSPRLGSILSNKERITGPLNQGDHVTISENAKNSSSIPEFRDSIGASADTSGGAFAKFVKGFAGDGDLIYTFKSDKHTVYSCAWLETFEFEPDDQYILDSISASLRVQNFIDRSFHGNKTVYMITGLKIATGFKMSTSTSKEHGPKLKVGVDFSAAGVPIEAGPQVDLTFGRSRETSHGPSASKIIFAYRLIKISPQSDGQVTYKDVKGGQYEYGARDDKPEETWITAALDKNGFLSLFPDSEPMAVEVSNKKVKS